MEVTIDGLPDGVSLVHPGQPDAVEALGEGSYRIKPAYVGDATLLQGLRVLVPEDFGGTIGGIGIHVTTRDSNGDTRVTDTIGSLSVAAVADVAVSHDIGGAEVPYAVGDVHAAVSLSMVLPVQAFSQDDDGSEVISYEIGGVPEGVVLSHGDNLGGGHWHLEPAQFEAALAAGGLTAPLANAGAWGLSPVDGFTLTVRAVSRDPNGSVNTGAEASFAVTWEDGVAVPVHEADARAITTTAFSGAEDSWIALPLELSGVDMDGGDEAIAVTFGGLPAGAQLSGGAYDTTTGLWVVGAGQLAGLAVRPPLNFSGTLEIEARVVVTEATGDVRVDAQTLSIDVAPLSDAAVISAHASGNETRPLR